MCLSKPDLKETTICIKKETFVQIPLSRATFRNHQRRSHPRTRRSRRVIREQRHEYARVKRVFGGRIERKGKINGKTNCYRGDKR